MARAEKLPVKCGADYLRDDKWNPRVMTQQQARRWGEKTMDPALRRAGFQCFVGRSDPEMHGGDWYRVSYGKR